MSGVLHFFSFHIPLNLTLCPAFCMFQSALSIEVHFFVLLLACTHPLLAFGLHNLWQIPPGHCKRVKPSCQGHQERGGWGMAGGQWTSRWVRCFEHKKVPQWWARLGPPAPVHSGRTARVLASQLLTGRATRGSTCSSPSGAAGLATFHSRMCMGRALPAGLLVDKWDRCWR